MNSITGFAITTGKMAAVILCTAIMSGCAIIGGKHDTESIDPVSSAADMPRAQQVFLYQSRIANALLERYPLVDILESADPTIIAAEARMMDSCSPLTRAALLHFEGKSPSLGLRLHIMASVDECERAAREMEQVLSRLAIADAI